MDQRATAGRVVISTDGNRAYYFFMPLTALLWARAGFRPLVMIVGDEAGWRADPRRRLALDAARTAGAEAVFLPPVPDLPDHNLAQIARAYAGCLPVPDDAYCLTSDMDMWPVDGAWFRRRSAGADVDVLYANAGNDPRYPMCYVGMAAGTWRAVMRRGPAAGGGDGGAAVSAAVGEQLRAGPGLPADAETLWFYDELVLGLRLREWAGYPHRCRLVDRHPHRDRIDRIDWRWSAGRPLAGLIDAHLPRPAYADEHWHPRVRPLLAALLGPDAAALARCDAYREQFVHPAGPAAAPADPVAVHGSAMDPFATHLPALVRAVTAVPGPVLEMGIGYYSTPVLHELCRGRELVTVELATERAWVDRFDWLRRDGHVIETVEDWDACPYLDRAWGVAFVDHKRGEDRKRTIARLADRAAVIVVHDTEEPGYGYEAVLSRFRHRWDDRRLRPWTTVVSNTVDVKCGTTNAE